MPAIAGRRITSAKTDEEKLKGLVNMLFIDSLAALAAR
jgi:hypothetical protein